LLSLKKLSAITQLGKNEISLIVIYSIVVGLLSLAVPIAAQALVNIVSFGSIRQPLFVLAFLVFLVLTAVAVVRILHIVLIENIQQHLFVHCSLDLAKIIPQWSQSVFDQYRGTEMMNRFFDIFTIQKTLAGIFISGIGVIMQVVLGMILLAVYHPLLLVFDIVLIITMTLAIRLPWRSSVTTALDESDQKYSVAGWLEEISRLFLLFKFSGNDKHALEVADNKISAYIVARQSHFRNLMKHVVSGHVIHVIASSSLLLLGGLLVIKNQLTLGQLVAAEIVVTAMGISISQFGKYFENIYDLLAATYKIDFLQTLPKEKFLPSLHSPSAFKFAPTVEIKNLNFNVSKKLHILKNVNFTISNNQCCAIYGGFGSGKSLLLEILLGLKEPSSGDVLYNNVSITDYSLSAFRQNTIYIKDIQFYDGTILENICIGKDIEIELVKKTLEKFDLLERILRLKSGLQSKLSGTQSLLSTVELQKLMLVRAALAKPYFLILDEILDLLPDSSLTKVMETLFSTDYSWTVIVATRRKDVMEKFPLRMMI
jgi:putative ABC transport system ATP-binding protein